MSKKFIVIISLVVAVLGLVITLAIYTVDSADAEVAYSRHETRDGMVCLDFGEWGYCFCEGECGYTEEIMATGDSSVAQEAASTPELEVTSTPEPDATKDSCNRGIGNRDEGCDPGNSSGKGKGGGRRAGEDRSEGKGPHK